MERDQVQQEMIESNYEDVWEKVTSEDVAGFLTTYQCNTETEEDEEEEEKVSNRPIVKDA